jgi:hypothetical protein
MTLRDFNPVEKITAVPRTLTTDGEPPGADPDVRDIGYYLPSSSLVLYFGDVGYFNGIVRTGQFDIDIAPIQAQTGDFIVTVEQAN